MSVSNSVYPPDKTGERDMGCRQLRDETESIDSIGWYLSYKKYPFCIYEYDDSIHCVLQYLEL